MIVISPHHFKELKLVVPKNYSWAWKRAQILTPVYKKITTDNNPSLHTSNVLLYGAAKIASVILGECWYSPLFEVYK